MTVISSSSLLVSCSDKKYEYTDACSKQDFTTAHHILQEMKVDINHKSAELKTREKNSKLPVIYQEYVDALMYVYGEELKFLLDQDNPQTEKRIKVLNTELSGEVYSLMTTFDGLAREYPDKQPFYNLKDNLIARMNKLASFYQSVKDVQNE